MVFGRLTHYAFDAVLISAFLAGVKRSTGLTYATPINADKAAESYIPPKWIETYLGIGEWAMDKAVFGLRASGWFERVKDDRKPSGPPTWGRPDRG